MGRHIHFPFRGALEGCWLGSSAWGCLAAPALAFAFAFAFDEGEAALRFGRVFAFVSGVFSGLIFGRIALQCSGSAMGNSPNGF